MKIAIIDLLGLTYDGNTLKERGLGGSESAVILMSAELSKLGHTITVYNNCIDSKAKPGLYDGVQYVDHSKFSDDENVHTHDIVISSRTVKPFLAGNQYAKMVSRANKTILWMHDTFCDGDHLLERLLMSGEIDEVFTLSDFHSWYVTSCDHGNKRNFEVLKHKFFQTRNGAVQHIKEVDLTKKDINHFVYNASATKGLIPLVTRIWPEIKKRIPEAHLTCIGGYYRFREGAEPDAQEKMVNDLIDSKPEGVTFTGVIPQYEIAEILSNAYMMLYPTAFPETFGISSLESLLYKTPIVTNTFGALEETAIEQACYKIPYSSTNNALFRNIDENAQAIKFVNAVLEAHKNTYLHYQKQNYCGVVKDIAGWDTVALQWDQHFHTMTEKPYPVEKYRSVSRINDKVARIYGRRFNNIEDRKLYKSYGEQRRIVVISPFRNADAYIQNHVRSIAQQDYDNYLHILIDDKSDNRINFNEMFSDLSDDIKSKIVIRQNDIRKGAVQNQLNAINDFVKEDDIVMLLDGDDWLINNNTIFHYYNDLYDQGHDFTYGSMWSLADNIPLIAQDWKDGNSYPWKIPYTHLRTMSGSIAKRVSKENYIVDGEWMMSGADNPLFRETISYANNPIAVKEIMVVYNDVNPLNDYKINGEEQNRNAIIKPKTPKDKFSVVVPTMWRSKSLFEKSLINMLSEDLVDEVIIINNDVSLTPKWKCLSDPKIIMLNQQENIKVNPAWNLGVKTSKNDYICIINDDLYFDNKLFSRLNEHKRDDHLYGFIVGGKEYNQTELTDGSINFEEWKPGIINYGFGQLMVINKNNWDPILDDLQVYFGDDFILYNHMIKKSKIFLISNMYYEEDFGATSKDLNINDIYYDKEKPIYFNWQNSNPFGEFKVKKILCAIPTNKYIEPETFKSIYDLEIPDGYEMEFQFFYGYSISQIRNLIAEWAKRYDYLFSVDSDIVVPKDALKKMITADKDIVSGMYIQRIPDTYTLELYMVNENGGLSNIPHELISQHNELVEIAGCGFGCVLIKGEVFRTMEYPHFYYQSALDHKDTVSEDIYFCKKARDLNFKIWVDTTIKCDHIGSTRFKIKENVVESHINKYNPETTNKDLGVTVIPDTYRNEKVFK